MPLRQILVHACVLLGMVLPSIGCQSAGQWEIFVTQVRGDGHRQLAETLAKDLGRVEQLNSSQVHVHDYPDRTEITYGRYGSVEEHAAQNNLRLIKRLGPPGGKPLFADAHLRPVSVSDPDVPDSWDLGNVKAEHTLLIATFTGPDRKEQAVALVRQLRKEKREEAYVYHYSAKSIVTVGSFSTRDLDRAVNPLTGRPGAVRSTEARRLQRAHPHALMNGHRIIEVTNDPRGGEIRTPRNTTFLPVPHDTGAF